MTFGTSPHCYILGWPVTIDWLRNFVIRSHNPLERAKANGLGVSAMLRLKLFSDYDDLAYVGALPDGIPISEPGPDMPIISVVAISFTISKRMFHQRPTQAQYDWFVDVFGVEPQWYRDIFSRKEFYRHGI